MSARSVSNRLPPQLLIAAYCQGVFPMGMDDGSIAWFSPDPRGIIPLDERFHVSRTLQATLRKAPFNIRKDTAFVQVMWACAHRERTWINEDIVAAYRELHDMGLAHSVEAWQGGELVGGLYGVSLRGAFFGESMFSSARDASKVCLVSLVGHLRRQGFMLLDTQWTTPHLERFGAYNVSRKDYLTLLSRALQMNVGW